MINVDDARTDKIMVTIWEHNDVLANRAVAKGEIEVAPLLGDAGAEAVYRNVALNHVKEGSSSFASPVLDFGAAQATQAGEVVVRLNVHLQERMKAEQIVTQTMKAYEQYSHFTGWSSSNLPPECPAFKSTTDSEEGGSRAGSTFAAAEPEVDDHHDWKIGAWKEVQTWQYGSAYNATKWYSAETPLLHFRRRTLKRVITHIDLFQAAEDL